MATGSGINPNSVFTRTDPADAAERIPNQATDGQAGYDIRTRDRWGVKITNATDQIVAFRVLGFTFEDGALDEVIELVASANIAAGGVAYEQGQHPGVARIQVEVDPAAAATGDLKVVFGTDSDG